MNIVSVGYKMQLLETLIRDQNTSSEELRDALHELGRIMGSEIWGRSRLSSKKIITPLLVKFTGKQLQQEEGISIVISTKDDYCYFANGIAEGFSTKYRGYIDFGGVRGTQAFTTPYRSLELPEIRSNCPVKRIVVAKSVVATGCTAITLAQKAIATYFPEELIIVAPFYSQQGIDELKAELKNAKIYVAYGPDMINEDGMLVPGIGDIDRRLA